MQTSVRLLSLSRLAVLQLVMVLYIMNEPSTPQLALYVISCAFFVASSSIAVAWIPVSPAWRRRVLWVESAWAVMLNFVAAYAHPGGPMPLLFNAILVNIMLDQERRYLGRTVALAAAACLLANIPGLVQLSPVELAAVLGGYGASLLFAGSVGALVRNLNEARAHSDELLKEVQASQAALERAHRQLQESAASQQAMAVLEERQRLAREIHDSVAHGLTALVVQAQAARRLLDRDPGQAAETIARCEEMAREALQETRRAVRAFHPAGLEQQADVEALRRLARDFGIATGMQITVTADEAASALPPDPVRLEQLYRIAQEALTNAHRHGQARIASVALTVDGNGLHLTISNDGAPPRGHLEPGVGMKSMSERARQLGGTTAFEPGPAGMTIRVTVPLKREVTA